MAHALLGWRRSASKIANSAKSEKTRDTKDFAILHARLVPGTEFRVASEQWYPNVDTK